VKGALVNHVLVFRTTLLIVCQSIGAVALQLNRILNASCMSISNVRPLYHAIRLGNFG